MPELYRKRLIPSECIHLKNDTIVSQAMIKIPTLIFLPICLPMLLLKMTVLSALWI